MQSVLALVRFWLLSIVMLVVPIGGLGALTGGLPGAIGGAGLGLCLAAVLALRLESIIGRMHGAHTPGPAGIGHSLERTLRDLGPGYAVPKIRVFADPSPNAFVARSWFGSGTVFLSQGLLTLLAESELRAVLRQAVLRLSSPGWTTRSFGAVLASLLLSRAPRGWVQAALGGKPASVTVPPRMAPSGLFGFVILCALARMAVRWSGSRTFESGSAGDPDWQDAVFKIRKELLLWPLGGNPGAVGLFLENPWPGATLMSLS